MRQALDILANLFTFALMETPEPIHAKVIRELLAASDDSEARKLMRFFKTGKGDYGEGDLFLGIRVPLTRSIVKTYRTSAEIEDVAVLVGSPYHEVRLAGFLLLIEIYLRHKKASDEAKTREAVDFYLSVIDRGNNWDLVDLIAPKILGDRLVDHPEERPILIRLADMSGHLWHQRVAVVATWSIICHGEYTDTLRIVGILLHHKHDLIHKANGWMLREIGKRGGLQQLTAFLDRHAREMPRTTLRYAIEHFPTDIRRHYMKLT